MEILGYILPLFFVWLYFSIAYIISEKKNNYGYIDIVWGSSFVVSSWVAIIVSSLVKQEIPSKAAIITLVCVSIWGIRLSGYLFKRNWNKPEDYRYVKIRDNLSNKKFKKILAYFKIFMTQAVLSILVSTVLIITINGNLIANTKLAYIFIGTGLGIWIIGFLFESIGDAQLRSFKADPTNKGKIMNKGLWSITRHPNYFGESVMWLGLSVIGFSVTYGYIGIISFILMTLLIVFVSGVRLLEKAFINRPGFNEYKERVSVFIPWFPKRKSKINNYEEA